MTVFPRKGFAPAALGAALIALAAPAAAQTQAFGPQIAQLVGAAAKEGHLELSWSGSGFGDNGKGLPSWMEAFNRFYGLHLTETYTPAPSMTQQAARLVQEAQSGTPAASDLVILGADSLLADLEANATRAYDWVELANEIGVALPPAAAAPHNAAVAFSTEIFGIVYNKNAVPAATVPQTLADVLKPQFKGRIASTPYAAGFNFLAAFDPNWGPAKTEAYVTKLARQIGGLMRCGESAPLLSGQFDMLVLECDVSAAIGDQRRGVPIGYVVPKDAPIMDLWYMAVPKTSRAPAAAALFALFMLTKEGQALSWQWDANDLALFPGSHTAALLPGDPARIAGGRGEQDFIDQPDTLKLTAQYIDILQRAAPR